MMWRHREELWTQASAERNTVTYLRSRPLSMMILIDLGSILGGDKFKVEREETRDGGHQYNFRGW